MMFFERIPGETREEFDARRAGHVEVQLVKNFDEWATCRNCARLYHATLDDCPHCCPEYTELPSFAGQSRLSSHKEAIANVIIGLVYASVLNYVLIRWSPFTSVAVQALWMTFWFTVASYVRQYALRRWFNKRELVLSAEMRDI